MTPAGKEAREVLMAHSDHVAAVRIANEVILAVNDMVNAANVAIGTSLLARALIVRGVESTAAEWWAQGKRFPTPVAFEALRSINTDMPPQFNAHAWEDPE